MSHVDELELMAQLLSALERGDSRWETLNQRLDRLESCLEAIGAGMDRIERRLDFVFGEAVDEEFPEAADWADPGVRSRH